MHGGHFDAATLRCALASVHIEVEKEPGAQTVQVLQAPTVPAAA